MSEFIYSDIIQQHTKYIKWYFNIISAASNRELRPCAYIENHHIIPKSLGGSNNSSNLVTLTAREHFLCHACLWKHFKHIGDVVKERKMGKAFNMMTINGNGQKRHTSRLFETARKLNTNKGATRTKQFKKNLSQLYSGNKAPKAKQINIYDSNDNLIFETHGNFKKVCTENNLPGTTFKKSYQNNTRINYKPGSSLTKAIKSGNIMYQGWYAKIIG